ncbi:glycosyltransferase family 39 protein [Sinomonas sp. P10A9]|uniref:Glycosyltransferase family 39 protein n=1 Tax=Sinomonas puerhi TaxID=3238584 RepID=A0AB39L015_9MICC
MSIGFRDANTRTRNRVMRVLVSRDAQVAAFVFVTGIVWLGWNVSINGLGNPYYAAATQSALANPHNLFFGASDLSGGESIDKPPFTVWLTVPLVAVFGLGSFPVLLPSIIMGAGSASLAYFIARTYTSHVWALLSGILVLAVPVHVSMSRINNPDAPLVFFCTAAVLAVLRLKRLSTASLVTGFLLGLGILTKQLQALLIVPSLMAVMVLRFPEWKRLTRAVVGAALASVGPSLLWMVPVMATPAQNRPWVGGTKNNDLIDLTIGYNGIGRLSGAIDQGDIQVVGASGPTESSGSLTRLLTLNYAPELLGFLIVGVLGVILLSSHAARSRKTHAALAALCLWFAVGFIVFSFMEGGMHPYYLSFIAIPAALLGGWVIESIIKGRHTATAWRTALALGIATISILLVVWMSWFPPGWEYLAKLSFITGSVAVLGLFLPGRLRHSGRRITTMGLVFLLAVPAAGFDVATMTNPQDGTFFLSGPVPAVDSFHLDDARKRSVQSAAERNSDDLFTLIQHAKARKWAAITLGGEAAARYQLDTGVPVIALAGFNGADGFPSQGQLESWIAGGDVQYYIHRADVADSLPLSHRTLQMVDWITTHFSRTDVSGVAVYDLTEPLS